MKKSGISGESDRYDDSRRRVLVLLGLSGLLAYVTPVLLNVSVAHADEGGDDGGDDDDDDHDDDGEDGRDDGRVVPPEAP